MNHRRIRKLTEKATTYCTLVRSCNGLICVFEPKGYKEEYGVADPVYICNPVIGECVDLPRLSIQMDYNTITTILGGFGYLPSTNEYKIVRIYYTNGPGEPLEPLVGHIQVYTLGSGNGCRNRGEITMYSFFLRTGILANGALHWFVCKNNEPKIVAFDLADETFHMVPSPTCFHDHNRFEIEVLGGWLSIVHHKTSTQSLDIWLLKKKKNKKPTTNSIEETDDQYYQSWSWSKEFTIEVESMNYCFYKPFGLTKSGEVLIWGTHDFQAYGTLLRYDPNTSNIEQLIYINYLDATPHMNSFVSLEANGEKCRERRICRRRKRPHYG